MLISFLYVVVGASIGAPVHNVEAPSLMFAKAIYSHTERDGLRALVSTNKGHWVYQIGSDGVVGEKSQLRENESVAGIDGLGRLIVTRTIPPSPSTTREHDVWSRSTLSLYMGEWTVDRNLRWAAHGSEVIRPKSGAFEAVCAFDRFFGVIRRANSEVEVREFGGSSDTTVLLEPIAGVAVGLSRNHSDKFFALLTEANNAEYLWSVDSKTGVMRKVWESEMVAFPGEQSFVDGFRICGTRNGKLVFWLSRSGMLQGLFDRETGALSKIRFVSLE